MENKFYYLRMENNKIYYVEIKFCVNNFNDFRDDTQKKVQLIMF